jgi:uncharacterized protein YaiI (UPF0178 family)
LPEALSGYRLDFFLALDPVERVDGQVAELAAKSDVLVARDVLLAEEQDLVMQE